MTRGRRHDEETKVRAVTLAAAVGSKEAAKQLGLSRRTIDYWASEIRQRPTTVVLEAESQRQVADKLWAAVSAGVDRLLVGMADPKARLADVARAVEVAARYHELLMGRATERTEATVDATVRQAGALRLPGDVTEELLLPLLRGLEEASDEDLANLDGATLRLVDGLREAAVDLAEGRPKRAHDVAQIAVRDAIDEELNRRADEEADALRSDIEQERGAA